ncbi:MAG: glycogen synthase [Clostridia bacterium]|nr:glycogen synthase [Clostridia bacterium]
MSKKILFAASEANPYAGTGGLGDVIGSLPKAIAELDDTADVRVVLPLYSTIKSEYRQKMKKLGEYTVDLSWRKKYCGLFSLKEGKVTYYFIDNEDYFKRNALYGNFDDGERYAFFCKAVMETVKRLDFIPDILHCNDWQSALCVIYQKHVYRFYGTKTVYTIHNIEYQGIYDQAILGDVFDLPEEARNDVVYDGCINLTKGAMMCANRVTTVSPRYAQEIRGIQYSSGLSYAVNDCAHKLSGIVNGIDYSIYDPKKNKDIVANYSKTNPKNKMVCKLDVQRLFGLPESPHTPMIAMISRLAAHKGFDILRRCFERLIDRDLQFVLLGTGEAELENYFENMHRRYPHKCGVMIAYNKAIASKIYAGADIFLMPSKSEPCGLAQMMACRYGTVPVVHAVGGLADTIVPYNPVTGKGNGVNFCDYDPEELLRAVDKALSLYGDAKHWKKLMFNAMSSDFSWQNSARAYLDLYNGI